MSARRGAAAAVFLAVFAVYLSSAPPSLAPWRDSGELAASGWTLGVSHPTSYPLYVLAARAAAQLPLGNPAYRLSLLSALAAALAVAALFELARRRWGAWGGSAAALLLGFNGTLWSVAIVQEMYSCWALSGVLALSAALWARRERSLRRWAAFSFAVGLALTNRLDLLLWTPGLLWIALHPEPSAGGPERAPTAGPGAAQWAGWALVAFPAAMILLGANWPMGLLVAGTAAWAMPDGRRARWTAAAAAAGLAGLSVYAYLPVRSATGPWLDWNHPAELSNFLDSLLRTRYGGTLDLLSKSYRPGELFGANMRLYARHLWSNFSLVGLAAAAWGLRACARRDPARALGVVAAYAWSGPIFLLMANLPPNPHAAAIVDPHYLLSDVLLAVCAAEGVGDWAAARAWLGPAACAALLAAPLVLGRPASAQRRGHLFDYDYARNVLRCAPKGATVVAKKDVQLYTLWYFQTVAGLRPDLRLVSQGLAGSPWYQAGWRRRRDAPALVALRDADGWSRFAQANEPAFATFDAEPPPEVVAAARPRGLLLALPPASAESAEEARGLLELAARRGDYDYESEPDFFTSDLVDAYAQARTRLGAAALKEGRVQAAIEDFLAGWSMHWIYPEPASFLGYAVVTAGRPEEGRRYYRLEAALNERLVELASRYRALPAVTQSLTRSAALAWTHVGVACEKAGDLPSARSAYERSLSIFPLAETHYDLAVLSWSTEPRAARQELEAALAVDPSYAPAAHYLAVLRSSRANSR